MCSKIYQNYSQHSSPIHSLCVDTILSFANKSTLVSRIMTTLTEFTIAWVQSPSEYDFLIARTVRDDWAAMNLPVISQRGTHHLYTGYHVMEPAGQVLICPYDCSIENRNWDSTKKKDILIECRRCKGSCTLPRVELDSKTLLGSRRIIKVKFPPPRIAIPWTFPPYAPTVLKPVRKLPPRCQGAIFRLLNFDF